MKFDRTSLAICAIAALLSWSGSDAFILRGGVAVATMAGFTDLPRGAGGFNQGMSIAADGTMVLRTDTYGAYKWNPTGNPPVGAAGSGTWSQLVTSSSMPADYVAMSPNLTGFGVYEIQVCYSNSSIMYMLTVDVNTLELTAGGNQNSTVFKSTNGGSTWSRTAFTPIPSGNAQENQGTYKEFGPKIAIDSSNCNHVYVGTAGSGLFLSTDGNTFSTVSTSLVPAALSTCTGSVNCGYSAMQIARYNPNIIYIGSGGNGIYQSTNGDAGPFTKLTAGSPPTSTHLTFSAIDEAAGSFQGTFYLADEISQTISSWNGSAWTTILTSVNAIAADPQTSGHLISIDNSGGTNTTSESFNAGSTWITTTHQSIAGDIGWIVNFGTPMSNNSWAFFDRSNQHLVYLLSNVGPWQVSWTSNISTSTTPTYTVFGRGIEQIVGNDIYVPPAAGSGGLNCAVLPGGWDFEGTCHNNFTSFPATYYPDYPSFAAIWSGDIATADSSNRIVWAADGTYAGGSQHSNYSDNGGTIWTSFTANLPSNEGTGGSMAASTSTNWCMNTSNVRQPYCTTNAGGSWSPISISGVTFDTNTGCAFSTPCRYLVADRVNQNQFTLMMNTGNGSSDPGAAGFYESTNSGSSWTSLGNSNSVASQNGVMRSIPGNAGHIWLASGFGTGLGAIGGSNAFLAYTANAGSTWTKVTNIGGCNSVGYGEAGSSYPNIFAGGCWLKISSTSTASSGTGSKTFTITGAPGHTILPSTVATSPVLIDSPGNSWDLMGHVISYSGGVLTVNSDIVVQGSGSESSFNIFIWGEWMTTSGEVTAPTWTQLDGLPGGSLDLIANIQGDMNILNRAYVAKHGSGFAKIN